MTRIERRWLHIWSGAAVGAGLVDFWRSTKDDGTTASELLARLPEPLFLAGLLTASATLAWHIRQMRKH